MAGKDEKRGKGKAKAAGVRAGKVAAATEDLSAKEYDKELKKLHVELVKLQEWVKHKGAEGLHRLRGARRRRQGRHDQGDHRAREPARVPRRRAAGADRAREVADVHAALHAAPAGGRRDRDLRPQLVQPRRRRARDGILHRGAGASASCRSRRAVEKAIVDSGIILLKYWLEVSPEEQTRRLEARIDDGRKIWKLSPMDLKSYSRWYDYSRARDEMFAATDTRMGAVVRRALATTRGARASTSSGTCSARSPTRTCRARRSSCRSARRASTRKRTTRSR